VPNDRFLNNGFSFNSNCGGVVNPTLDDCSAYVQDYDEDYKDACFESDTAGVACATGNAPGMKLALNALSITLVNEFHVVQVTT
jgi:hypothetical protein